MATEPATVTACGLLSRAVPYICSIVAAAGLYVAHEHFAVRGQATPSIACLVGAAALAPFAIDVDGPPGLSSA